jgi:uncharacterized protein YbcI
VSTPLDVPFTPSDEPTSGRLNAAMANAVVHVHSHHTGRGPTKARVYTSGNVVVAVMHDALTRGERALATGGQREAALQARRGLHQTMRDDLVSCIEELTGRRVVAFLCDNQLDPDVAAQLFVLDRAPDPAGMLGSPPRERRGGRPRPGGGPGAAGRQQGSGRRAGV